MEHLRNDYKDQIPYIIPPLHFPLPKCFAFWNGKHELRESPISTVTICDEKKKKKKKLLYVSSQPVCEKMYVLDRLAAFSVSLLPAFWASFKSQLVIFKKKRNEKKRSHKNHLSHFTVNKRKYRKIHNNLWGNFISIAVLY